ncbi:condensin-2 complex subunit CAP-D3-like [Castanea sativa]|uniref:condensin-2 complex subunit CAP-D3-like n=1 Tax=Castanea sativa TaxID=21020 RepID=UPI003F649492
MELTPEPAADLAHNLLKRIEEFNMHSTEINAHVKALRTLCKQKASNPEEADTLVMRWVWSLTWHYSIPTVLKSYFLENSLKSYPCDNSSGSLRKTILCDLS